MAKLSVEIVTPARRILSKAADDIYLPGARGEIGILPGHAAMVSTLSVGVVRLHDEGAETKLAVRNGFLQVEGDKVTLLADEAALPNEVDDESLRKELETLRAKLAAEGLSPKERESAQGSMDWAKARLRLAG